MELSFLDMGDRPYGDAILVQIHGKTILIDGGHPGDHAAGRATAALQDQIAGCMNRDLPVEIDLLVITHCHSDHIGCLPELILRGHLKVKAAVVTDEKLGFGRTGNELSVSSDDVVANKVVAALREEPIYTGRSSAELAEFLEDAATVESRYLAMLAHLESAETKVARFGIDDLQPFMASLGLRDVTLIVPSMEQLLRCAEAINRFTTKVLAAIQQVSLEDNTIDAVNLYKRLASPQHADDFMSDAAGKGAALNDQSLIVVVGNGKNKCLLTADMQFAEPEVKGISLEMGRLRAEVARRGPYALVKLPHHGSYNGVDESLINEWKCSALVISTGRGHSAHPSSSTLDLLNSLVGIQWARTDKNGLVTARIRNGIAKFAISSGILNDASPNGEADQIDRDISPSRIGVSVNAFSANEQALSTQSARSLQLGEDYVEVSTRVPNRKMRVVVTIDVDPSQETSTGSLSVSTASPSSAHDSFIGSEWLIRRDLPPLLFLTNMALLVANVGIAAVQKVQLLLAQANQELLDLGTRAKPWVCVQGRTPPVTSKQLAGVVILGGHDVLPSVRQDVLPMGLRTKLGSEADTESDSFYVWSDDPYGDVDGDGLAELPVSRIPDAKCAAFLIQALCANFAGTANKKGIRNRDRPFADVVFATTQPGSKLLQSDPHLRKALTHQQLVAPALYFMLHGSHSDGTTFWGEDAAQDYVEAISVAEVPVIDGATVFTACCWGALTVESRANVVGKRPIPRTIESSIALTCLKQGANAFVGCTGSHYSPTSGGTGFGAPMHVHFWRHLDAGCAPALALYKAKSDYSSGMFHGAATAQHQAFEYKIQRQFTCLGLGW